MDDQGGGGEESGGERLKTVVSPSTVKAFVAGLVLGNINKGLLLGLTVGVLGGVFVQQSFGRSVPNMANTWKDFMKRWKNTGGGSNSGR